MLRLISLLLFPLVAFGQGYTPRRPFVLLSPAPSTPDSIITNDIPGIYLWWHSGDLPVGTNVTNWTDRIQGLQLKSPTTTYTTNSADGVYFDGTHYFTNTYIGFGTLEWNILVISKQWNTSGAQMVLGDVSSVSPNGNGVPQFNGNGNTYWVHYLGQFVNMNIPTAVNQLRDIFVVCTNTSSRMTAFTNGIHTTLQIPQTDYQLVTIGVVGNDYSLTQPLKAYVLDIIIWTNISTFAYTAPMISNAHYWVTNVSGGNYPITP